MCRRGDWFVSEVQEAACAEAPDPGAPDEERVPELAIPDRPSIDVLPFLNLSGDPQREYFSDGITEDTITALSWVKWFFVIARTSSFTYKARAVPVTRIAPRHGVRSGSRARWRWASAGQGGL